MKLKLKLNTKQWIVIACGLLLFFLSELFPPWMYQDGNTSAHRSAGYHHSEPAIKSEAEMKALFGLSVKDVPSFSVYDDYFRLCSQRIAIPFLLFGFVLVLRDERRRRVSIAGSFLLFIGFAFAGFALLLALG